MKNRSNNGMDAELERKLQGLSKSQIKLMADIYAGLAEQLSKKKVADSLKNWKTREDWSRN